MARVLGLVAFVVSLLCGALPSPGGAAAIGSTEFEIEEGSRLAGTVFPTVLPSSAAFRGYQGWTVYLDITGPAGSVYDAYAARARMQGMDVPFSDAACEVGAPGDVQCGALNRSGRPTFEIAIRVCSLCDAPIAAGRISYLAPLDLPESQRKEIDVPATRPEFELQLDAAQRASMLAARPTSGEAFGLGDAFAVPEGGRVLADTTLGTCSEEDEVSVLRLTQRPNAAFRTYVERLRVAENENPVRVKRTAVGTATVAQARNDQSTVTLVKREGRSFIAVDSCI